MSALSTATCLQVDDILPDQAGAIGVGAVVGRAVYCCRQRRSRSSMRCPSALVQAVAVERRVVDAQLHQRRQVVTHQHLDVQTGLIEHRAVCPRMCCRFRAQLNQPNVCVACCSGCRRPPRILAPAVRRGRSTLPISCRAITAPAARTIMRLRSTPMNPSLGQIRLLPVLADMARRSMPECPSAASRWAKNPGGSLPKPLGGCVAGLCAQLGAVNHAPPVPGSSASAKLA